MPVLKNPYRYGDYFYDDDFWKLEPKYRLTDLRRIHPILGWSQTYISKDNPLGLYEDVLNNLNQNSKTKILFYGDSFVRGCGGYDFQIPRLMNLSLKKEIVVDLSVGGYGLDQMLLMFELTYTKAENPYIIFGVLTEDVDRAILRVRSNQKPYFIIKDDKLDLKGIPVDKNFYAKNPPKINSYLFRLVYRELGNKFQFKSYKSIYENKDKSKKEINSKIIDKICKISKNKNYPLLFVLFYRREDLDFISWQEDFLKTKLTKLNIKYFDTKPVLIQYAADNKVPLDNFYVANNGHHNAVANKVIAEGLFKYLSKSAKFN